MTFMKNMRHMAIAGCLIPGLLFGVGVGQSQQKNNFSMTSSNSSTSFKEVTTQLDPGGSFYLYISLKKWVQGLSQVVVNLKKLSQSNPSLSQEEKQNLGVAFDVIASLIQKSGIEDLSGFGASSIDREGLQVTKSALYHEPGKDEGFMWSLFGEKPHALEGLNLLPSSTVLAFFADFNMKVLMSMWEDIVSSATPEGVKEVQSMRNQFAMKNQGLQLDQLLDSLGNEYGIIVKMDPVKTMSVPIGLRPVEIPEPHGMFVVKVKNDLFFQYLLSQFEDEKTANLDTANLKMRKIMLPFNVPLIMAQSGEYLFLASSEELLKESLAVKSGKEAGLKTAESFKELARGMPEQGNSFSYIDKRLVETIGKLYISLYEGPFKSLLPATTDIEILKSISYKEILKNGSYSISMNTPEGFVGITQQK